MGIIVKYKMIAADMDGTLLNDRSELSERTKAAIAGAVEAGALFVTATGRAMQGAEAVNALFDEDMPFIIINGASAVLGKSRKVLFNKYLSFYLTKEVLDICMDRDIPAIIRTSEGIWASRESEATSSYFGTYHSDMRVIQDINELRDENIFKAIWFDTASSVMSLQSELNSHFRGRLNCHSSMPEFLEFVSADADKGSALADIGKIYGVARDETIAIGDGFNDVSMLKYAGLGVAMGNAPAEVKAVCERVTRSNTEDGAAAIIEEYLL